MQLLLRIVVIAFLTLAAVAAGVFSLSFAMPGALKPQIGAPGIVRIDNAAIVSMAPGAPEAQRGLSVLVVDGEIVAVAPASEIDATGARVIDAAGATLLPGLIDAHVHVFDEAELAGYLAHGVTSVRNMSGMPLHLDLEKRIAAGRIVSPDLVTTGPILNSPGPNQQANHVLVSTAAEAAAEVRRQHANGYRRLKVYSNLTREAFDAVLAEADALGMTVTGHTPEGERAHGVPHDKPFAVPFSYSLDKGFTTIEHVESVAWHGLRGALDEEGMRALAGEIVQAGVPVTTTLIAHDNLVRVAESKGAYLDRPGAETVNPALKMFEEGTYAYWSEPARADYERPRGAFYRKATKMLHEAGVTLVAGSDAGIFTNIPGAALTRELELLVASGLTPHEALEAATVNAAAAIGLADRGRIAPGYRANLILVDGDPLSDVSVVENPSAVMIGGVWYDADGVAAFGEAARQTSLLRSMRRLVSMFLAQ